MAEQQKRKHFRVALVGQRAVEHESLVRRAGYRLQVAADGTVAGRLFRQDTTPFDALVVDFELDGRPPEAVLLFCRRTSPTAPVIALVSHADESGFRRAFMAGARDVLPSPVRGEDLLDAIDLALEPRALSLMLEDARKNAGEPPPYNPDEEDALVEEIHRLQRDLTAFKKVRSETASVEARAQKASDERDALEEELHALRVEFDRFKRESENADASIRIHEKATQELYSRLKGTRDEKRTAEQRAARAESALHDIQVATGQYPVIVDDDDESTASVRSWEHAGEIQPEEGLTKRGNDVKLLAELDRALLEKARLEEKLKSFEERTFTTRKAPDEETTLIASDKEMGLPAELDRVVRQRDMLGARVLELEGALSEAKAVPKASVPEPLDAIWTTERLGEEIALLERQRDAAEAGVGELAILRVKVEQSEKERHALAEKLDEILRARDHLRRHLTKTETELADALEKVEELSGLLHELENLKGSLRTERTARSQLKRRFAALDSYRRKAELVEKTHEDEDEAQKRQLVMAIARADALNAELEDARLELANARALLRANLTIERPQGEM